MGEPILEPGRQAGMCFHDGSVWRKAKGDAEGHAQVDVLSSALPTGAATETTLSSLLTELQQKLETADLLIEAAKQLAVAGYVFDGTTWQKAKGDIDGHQQVDVVSAPTTVVIPHSNERLVGFSGIVEEALINKDLLAGTNTLNGSAVPVGEVWKVTAATIHYSGTPPSALFIMAVGLADELMILHKPSPSSETWYFWNGEIYLQSGDYMCGVVTGATAGDDLRFRYAGIKMAAP